MFLSNAKMCAVVFEGTGSQFASRNVATVAISHFRKILNTSALYICQTPFFVTISVAEDPLQDMKKRWKFCAKPLLHLQLHVASMFFEERRHEHNRMNRIEALPAAPPRRGHDVTTRRCQCAMPQVG